MAKTTVSKRNVAYSAEGDTTDVVNDEIVCQMCFALEGVERMRCEIAEGGDLVDGLHGKVQNSAIPVAKAYRQDVAACMDILKKRRDAKPPESNESDPLADFNA